MEKSRPAHEIRMGRIRCMIWSNKNAEQATWYSVTFTRSYKDDKGNANNARSFGRDDLLVLAEVSRQAFLWVAQQQVVWDGPAESSASEPCGDVP